MTSSVINIPRRLPILVVENEILLPGASMRIPIVTPKNMTMIKNHLLNRNTLTSTLIAVIPKELGTQVETEDYSSLHGIGTAAVVVQITGTNWPRPAYTLLLTGLCRVRLERVLQENPFPIGLVTQLDKLPTEDVDLDETSGDVAQLIGNLREQAARLVDMLDISVPIVAKLKRMLDSVPNHHLADICASIIRASYQERLKVLDAVDLADRFRRTLPLLMRQIESLQLLQRARKGQNMVKPLQVKRIVRTRLPTDEINEDDSEDVDDISELENKIKAAQMPDHARKVAMKELQRLKRMTPQMPEYAMSRSYLELMAELPWSKKSSETLDIHKSRRDLDADHYAMDKLKKRVLEYLAVRQLRNSLKGPILCFVGPPGVGKTSVGRSIANTLSREFHRISLGGVCDQSDIRGHRRTYIGAMPGRIIQGLRTVQTNNPVVLLDEIDKMGSGIHGDPAAALLEVLDPEQNFTFTDHYLNVPFDLSQVLFIATANSTATIPPALLDRMEVIYVTGYTQEEKVQIALKHLIPKQLKEHGLSYEILNITDDSIKAMISKYTHEAGVRSLERKIGAVCRAVAVLVAEKRYSIPQDDSAQEQVLASNKTPSEEQILSKEEEKALATALDQHPPELPVVIDEAAVMDILGPPIYDNEVSGRLGQPGLAVGLAWTPVGGELMFVEATQMEGDSQLVLTGQLGDVMKESARLAINWVRSHARLYGIKVPTGSDLMENKDVHIHFPAGAVGKDGPSAGVTIVCVLISLFTGRCVRTDVAMTGEITLRGMVLPVGGVKDKVLAAHRAGIRTVILPKRNEKDITEIPTSVQKEMKFVFATDMDSVLQAAFEDGFPDAKNCSDVPSKL